MIHLQTITIGRTILNLFVLFRIALINHGECKDELNCVINNNFRKTYLIIIYMSSFLK